MNGSRQMTRRYAEKIEKAYGIGADWLLYGREECKDYPCDDEMISFFKSNQQARKKSQGNDERESKKKRRNIRNKGSKTTCKWRDVRFSQILCVVIFIFGWCDACNICYCVYFKIVFWFQICGKAVIFPWN